MTGFVDDWRRTMNHQELNLRVSTALDTGTLLRMVVSDAVAKDGPRRVEVSPVEVRGQHKYQFAYHDAGRVTHRNLSTTEAAPEIAGLLDGRFRQAQVYTRDADLQVSLRPGGKASVTERPPSLSVAEATHDRRKQYLLPEGEPVDFLVRLGVMTAAGKVVAARYDKFRQINRFLEMVADVADQLDPSRPDHVVDFGSGKSYLTFALYHYLRSIRCLDARVTGLDLKRDVIAHCEGIARELGYEHLRFVAGDIAHFEAPERPEMVVSLHACDTATDDTLAKAVRWEARVILAVPCCQHELFRKLKSEPLRPLLKYGILKERETALVTDAIRGALLELNGYSIQLLEFIEMEHTPKNILIRAVRTGRHPEHARLLREYLAFKAAWGVEPYLESLLPVE